MKRANRAIVVVALLLSALGFNSKPALADRNWHGLTVGEMVVTIPADGRTYSIGGITVRAVPLLPALTVTSCDIGFNAPVKLFVLGWPSIVNTGGIICYSPVTGQAVMMGSVSLRSDLIEGTAVVAQQWKIWNFEIVAEFWSWPMATCVTTSPSRSYRQKVWSGAATMGGATDSGTALSLASSLPCRRF